MRRPLLAILVAAALAIAPGVSNASATVTWEATGCDEVTLAVPASPAAPGLPPGTTALTVLVYRCDRATIGEKVVAPLVVSEIGAVTPAGIVLLREVSNSVELFKGLRRLGVPAFYSPTANLDVLDGPAGIAEATIRFASRAYSVSAAAIPDPAGTPSSPLNGPGATYRSSGKKGDVTVSYENRFNDPRDGPGAAVGAVDASEDAQLAAWLGFETSAGPGIYVRGDWTGTAAPSAT